MTIIEMEGYTFKVDGDAVMVRANRKNTTTDIWRGVPTGGPVWTRVMKAAGIEVKPVEASADAVKDATTDAPAKPAKPESKAARKRREKAERDAAEAAAATGASIEQGA